MGYKILMGSVPASIGLAIALVIAIALVTGRTFILRLEPPNIVMLLLLLTLAAATLTFSLPRTNILLGCVHLLRFFAFIMLMCNR